MIKGGSDEEDSVRDSDCGRSDCALSLPAASQNKGNTKPMQKEGNEQHPEIRHAIQHLEQAKHNLENAAHDFGGHRAKALEECQQALSFDKK